ncbi:MAG: polysaccharide biosynthesis/export family protein [Lentisphaerae bacterium]|nr:polysaccharide biosynthesis/export family protein [Lentisphaerota bacterium]
MKHLRLLLTMPTLLLLVGCSSQDFGRPIGRIGDVVDSGEAYVKEGGEEDALRRATQLASILAEWERQKTAVDTDYTLGPDDVLTIGILSLEAPEKVTALTRTISKDGTVTLPLIGVLACVGKTARQFQVEVINAYSGRYLNEPQVDVAVLEYRSAPVVVTGAVSKPGVYYLRHNQSSVLEVLSLADGLAGGAGDDLLIVRKRDPNSPRHEPPPAAPTAASSVVAAVVAEDVLVSPEPWTGSHIQDLVIRGTEEDEMAWVAETALAADDGVSDVSDDAALVAVGGDVGGSAGLDSEEMLEGAAGEMEMDEAAIDLDADLLTVDLRRLLDEGDMRLNLPIQGGDIVTVPPGRNEYIYVMGYVQRPGAFDLNGRKHVRALQAVAMAGGLSGSARSQNSFLIIDKPGGRKVVPIDLTKIARGSRPPVYMESGNTLVIGSSMMGKLAEFIKPSANVGATLTPGI